MPILKEIGKFYFQESLMIKEKISKKCMQHFVDGLNCHYDSDFKIKGNDDEFIVFNNDEEKFDSTKSLHLNFIQKDGKLTIHLVNYSEQDSKLKNIFKNSKLLNPVKTVKESVLNLITTALGDDFCSYVGISSEVLCIFIKYMKEVQ